MELPIFKISLTKVKSYTFLDVLKGEAWNRSQKYCIKEKDLSHYGKATKRKKGFDSCDQSNQRYVAISRNWNGPWLYISQCQLGCGISKMVGLNNIIKGSHCIFVNKMTLVFSKSFKIVHSMSITYVTDWFFFYFFFIENTFFVLLYFLISCPIFDKLTFIVFIQYIQWFLKKECWFLAKNLAF